MLSDKSTKPIKTITVLSNGYGEDSIGSLLLKEFQLQSPDLKLQAFPTVDRGNSYESKDEVKHKGEVTHIEILGPRKVMPSGGLLLHSLELFLADMRAGFVHMTLQQLWQLRRTKTDVVLVVGDVYALALSQLIPCKERYFVQSLVSRYHQIDNKDQKANRYIMENISPFERWLIKNTVKQMYVRDELTASWLQEQGLQQVQALGNPMLDALELDAFDAEFDVKPVIALLPGTREYALASLKKMFAGLDSFEEFTALVAWAREEDIETMQGWQKVQLDIFEEGYLYSFIKDNKQVHVFRKRFSAVLQSCQLVLGTSGTAHEQAASLAKPIVSFAMPPFYNQAFLDNQKRLLGDSLIICDGSPQGVGSSLTNLLSGVGWQEAITTGPKRMGQSGGSKKIVLDILNRSDIL